MSAAAPPSQVIGDIRQVGVPALAAVLLLLPGCTDVGHDSSLSTASMATLAPHPTWAGELAGSLPHVERTGLWLDFDLDRDADLVVAEDGWIHLMESTAGLLTRVASAEAFPNGVVRGLAWTAATTAHSGLLAVAGENEPAAEDPVLRVFSIQEGVITPEWSNSDVALPLMQNVAWGDCDGDGDHDLAAGTDGGPPLVFEATGDGYQQVWSGDVIAPDGRIGWIDADGDGVDELAQLADHAALLLHAGAGDCAALTALEVGQEPAIDFAWGDMDGDLDPDLVTTSGAGVDLWLTEFGLPAEPQQISALQLDRDDRLHLVDLEDTGWLDVVAGTHVIPALGEASFGPAEGLPCLLEDCGESIGWGDLDGDRRPDLLAKSIDALPGRSVLRVRQRRSGAQGYRVAREFSFLTPRDVLMFDWDRDGRLDLATTGWGWSGIYAAIPDTNATEMTLPQASFALGLAGQGLAACDLDGDGADELAVALADRGVAVYRNQAGQPELWHWLPERSGGQGGPSIATAVACADWDADGAQDLVVGYSGASPAVFTPGAGGFVESWAASDGPMWTRSLAWTGSRTQSAGPALAASNLMGADRIYLPGPAGEVEVHELRIEQPTSALLWSGGPPAQPTPGGLSETPLLVAGDLNGLLEVLQVSSWPPEPVEQREFAEPILDLAAGDLDGDPVPDYVVGTLQSPWTVSGPGLWNLAGGGGAQLRPLGAIAVGDASGDGVMDLVRAPGRSVVGHENVVVSLQRSSLPLSQLVEPEGAPSTLVDLQDLDFGDLDGDGRSDLIVAGPWGTVSGLGTGRADAPFELNAAPSEAASAVAIGTTSEGALLAVQDGSEPILRLYRVRGVDGPGRVRFDEVLEIVLVRPAADLAWADADMDGDLDLAVAGDRWVGDDLFTGTTLFENRDEELFPVWSSGSQDVTSISWGDIDGDGWPDLAEGSGTGYDKVHVNARGYSDDWLRPVQLFDGMATRRVLLGDWNGDGLADLLRAGQGVSGLVLHRNVQAIGDGWFTEVWSADLEDDIDDVAWLDLDSDGDLDIVALANEGTNTQVLLASNPDWGTVLREGPLLKAGDGAPFWRIGAADLDEDGDPDLVLAGATLRYLISPVHPLPALPNTPVFPWVGGPVGGRTAEPWASSAAISWGTVELPCAVFDGQGDLPASEAIRIEYALSGANVWRLGDFSLVDAETAGGEGRRDCRLIWSVPDEGLSDPAVRVRFSLLWQASGQVAAPVQHGRVGAISPAFPMNVPPDGDGDGHRAGVDCDDADPTVRPGAYEVCDDGVDQDCDGADSGPLDPHCWPDGWTCGCATARRGVPPAVSAVLLLPLLLLLRRRRRRRWPAALLLPALLLLPVTSLADGLDPIRTGLDAGRCEEALTAARGRVQAEPDGPAWALLGEAAACMGRDREAALAWRRARALGHDDPLVDLKLRRLEERLALLVLIVPASADADPPRVQVLLDDEQLQAEPDATGAAVLHTLTAGAALSVVISGPGYAREEIDLPPLLEGERRTVPVEPTFVGFGRLRFVGPPIEGCALVALVPEAAVPYQPGLELQVAAGSVQIQATGMLGRREVEVEVPRDGVVEVDPATCCSAGLIVSRAPAGAVLRLRGAHESDDRVVPLPDPRDSLDADTGIWLAGPLTLDSLAPGLSRLVVEHEILGSHTLGLGLSGGSSLRLDLDPGAMSRAPVVSQAFQRHRRGIEVRFGISLAVSLVASAALGLVSGALWQRADSVERSAQQHKADAIADDALGDRQGTLSGFYAWESSHVEGRQLVAGAAITAGMAVVASGFAVAVSVDFGRRRSSWSGWDPAEAVGEGTVAQE